MKVLKYALPHLKVGVDVSEDDAELIPIDDFDDGVVGEPYQDKLDLTGKDLPCEKCPLMFPRIDLKLHYLEKHFQEEFRATFPSLKCVVCDLEFKIVHNVHRHIVVNHEQFLEDILKKENLSLPARSSPKKTKKNTVDPYEEPFDLLKCQICWQNFKTSRELKIHYVTHLTPDFPTTFFCKGI